MLETIDGGAAAANNLSPVKNLDTSWDPDFEEPDFTTSNGGIIPNIIAPSDSAVECSFDGWEFSDNEMEAIKEYNKNEAPFSEVIPPSPSPPPTVTDVTAGATNAASLNISIDNSELKRQSRLSLAKQKYDKYVKSPKDAKKLEEQAAKEEQRAEVLGAAARRRERRASKKDKFKKMIKYKSNTSHKPVVSPDPKVFDPWLTEVTPKEEDNEEWENADGWAKDAEEVCTPVKTNSTDVENQDIFRPKGESGLALPSPASKELTDVLKDIQGNFNEVSAITNSSSLLLDETADYDYDFNPESTPINVRDRDFQSKIYEKIADAPVEPRNLQGKEEAEKPASPNGNMSFFTCGMLNVESSPKQVMINFTRAFKTGMKNGLWDVGEGVDVVAEHVQQTKTTWKEDVNKSRNHTKEYIAFGYKQ